MMTPDRITLSSLRACPHQFIIIGMNSGRDSIGKQSQRHLHSQIHSKNDFKKNKQQQQQHK